jgi:hypothetical protein
MVLRKQWRAASRQLRALNDENRYEFWFGIKASAIIGMITTIVALNRGELAIATCVLTLLSMGMTADVLCKSQRDRSEKARVARAVRRVYRAEKRELALSASNLNL